MLPPTIPIFPLPNVVLFPNVFLPLHIFEPRYRQMVDDALKGDRIVGMVLLRPDWEGDYEGRPPVYPVGCAGVITHAERLPDGRFNIVLRGMEKFRVTAEDHSRGYRLAEVESISEPPAENCRAEMRGERRRLEALLVPQPEGQRPSTSSGRPEFVEGRDPKVPSSMPDEDLVNALAQYLELDIVERQALLECRGVLARCRALIDVLEMKLHAPRGGWTGTRAH